MGRAVTWWEKRRDLGSAWGRVGGGGGKSRKDPKQGCPGVVIARVGEEGNSCVQNIRGKVHRSRGPSQGTHRLFCLSRACAVTWRTESPVSHPVLSFNNYSTMSCSCERLTKSPGPARGSHFPQPQCTPAWDPQ